MLFFTKLQTGDKILRQINVHHGLLQVCEFIACTSYVMNMRKTDYVIVLF